MNELALFAGAGGGILGGRLLGWRTVCAVERDAYPAAILAQRQNDGMLEPFPIWSDVTTFDGRPWRGIVDIISGGFPCQDISSAGRGEGISGERSGLWSEMWRIIGEVRPRFAFIENSPMLSIRGLDVVLCDLASLGYDARWGVMGAADMGAPHRRDRIWVLAYTSSIGQQGQGINERSSNSKKNRKGETGFSVNGSKGNKTAWFTEPDLGRVANGVAFSMDRLKAIGNGQVPSVAAAAFTRLARGL